MVEGVYTGSGVNLTLRSREPITEFFRGWDLVEPGVVAASEWRPDGDPEDAAVTPAQVRVLSGAAIKP